MNTYSQEEVAIIERICTKGELQAMDCVEVYGLVSAKGARINGKRGMVLGLSDDNDGDVDPYKAQLPDGRYRVSVDMKGEGQVDEVRPGKLFMGAKETEVFSLKRENLKLTDIQPGTFARDPEGLAMLRRRGMNITTTAEADKAAPDEAGMFMAIRWGDAVRVREIMEAKKRKGIPNPADANLDAGGDTALSGAVQHGHSEIVKVLIEYGADCNRFCHTPSMRNERVTYFIMALLLFDHVGGNAEECISSMIDEGGANVNSCCAKGTPLSAAVQIKSDHDARMRVMRKLLDAGADPNQIISMQMSSMVNQSTALQAAAAMSGELGNYSKEQQLEVVQLLVDAGADPGLKVRLDSQQESCNAIHCAVSHQRPDILKIFLSSEKGKAGVDVQREQRGGKPGDNYGDGETAITMVMGGPQLEESKANREMAVMLLRARADTSIADVNKLSADVWLRDPYERRPELARLVKRAKKLRGRGAWERFWDENEDVKAFIREGNDKAQCDNCGVWEGTEFHNGRVVDNFQRCSRCKKVFYCSRECQKKRWLFHKKVCTKVS